MAFEWSEFRRGVIDILPVVTAAVPIGLLFGTLAAAKGIAPTEAVLMSASVFAGMSALRVDSANSHAIRITKAGFTNSDG